jgi:DNA-binding transcriptional MerR regulator
MIGKGRVQKRLYFKIGEACKELGIQPYVLRYWETEFPALAPSKSRSGQRVYSEKEMEIIRRIKQLLYEEGYTIAGAKKKLETELANGSLGMDGEDGSGETPASVPAVLAPVAVPAASAKGARRKAAEPPVAAVPAATAALDTDAAERIQTLRSGIEKALQEAREILDLLDSKSA